MNLQEIIVRPVGHSEEAIFQQLMRTHHYLGALPKIGNTLWYVCDISKRLAGLACFFSSRFEMQRTRALDRVGLRIWRL